MGILATYLISSLLAFLTLWYMYSQDEEGVDADELVGTAVFALIPLINLLFALCGIYILIRNIYRSIK